jgi:hypothetical protein
MRKKLLAVAAAVLLVGAAAAFTAGPAKAASSLDLTCALGTTTVTYNPGITFTPSNTTATIADTYDTCTGSDPTISSGTDFTQATLTLSCDQLLAPTPVFDIITWSNGSQSEIDFTGVKVDLPVGAQVVELEGDVVAGEFAGDVVVDVNTFLDTNLLGCVAPGGLTSLDGTNTLEITAL